MRRFYFPLLFSLLATVSARAEHIVGAGGNLERMRLGKGWTPVRTDIRIPTKGWKEWINLSTAKEIDVSTEDGQKVYRTVLLDNGDPAFDLEQRVRLHDEGIVFTLKIKARKTLDIEAILFVIEAPAAEFAGGTFSAGDADGGLPEQLQEHYHLFKERVPQLTLVSPDRKINLETRLSAPKMVLLQDNRKWTQNFATMIEVVSGSLPPDKTATLEIVLKMTGEVEDVPANVVIDAAKTTHRIDGIGGNYCFNIESPVTQFTLDNLNPGAARTEINLGLWEPQNDDDDPNKVNWPALVAQDVKGTRLNQEFELMAELNRRKIPYGSSIWWLPGWMYTKLPRERRTNGMRIAADKWPEFLESLGTYLQYAKEKYKAEPDYFSFNEPDIGIDILLTAAEHRDAVKRIGEFLAQKGFKTKMLAGDVAQPRDTHTYAQTVLEDADALKHVSAISFHSWGGASQKQYEAWRALAQQYKLPLIVAEAGPDPAAWQGNRFQTLDYGIQEMSHYLQILLHAQPQQILFWEYTADYSLITQDAKRNGAMALTERYAFQKHWTEFIPPGSEGLSVSNDSARVQGAAFRLNSEPKGYAIHLGNAYWQRKVVIKGIPADVKQLNVVRTKENELFKQLEPVDVVNGTVSLELPGRSLTTLTTRPIPELKAPPAPAATPDKPQGRKEQKGF